jgi:hypothetical protein
MKQISLLIIAIIGCSACNDLLITDIKGKWQLKTVEMNDESITVDTVWYNFQSESVFGYQFYYPPKDTFLILLGTRIQNEKLITVELESSMYLEHTDWVSTERTFTVEELTDKHLILSSEDKIYKFNKY